LRDVSGRNRSILCPGRAIGSVGMLTFLSAAIVAVFLSRAERE
jgi:hypothetical protein